MRRSPARTAETRWRLLGNKRVAVGHPIRKGLHRAASSPIPDGETGDRIQQWAARRKDGFALDYGEWASENFLKLRSHGDARVNCPCAVYHGQMRFCALSVRWRVQRQDVSY